MRPLWLGWNVAEPGSSLGECFCASGRCWMFNLFVTCADDAWEGRATTFPIERCVKEHEGTNCKLASKYGVLTQENIRDLMQLPCIFAYESIVDKDARLGHITRILKRGRDIRIEYELLESQRISDEKPQST